MRIRDLLFIPMLLFFLSPINISAYIIPFYQQEPMIYDISHRSIVIYDKENQKVGLIPQMSFRGRPLNFCAVVPTPTVPRLISVDRDVFYGAEALTSPVERERGAGCLSGGGLGWEEYEEFAVSTGKGVSVINEQSVGIFDAVTLSATDPDALINWLQENQYKYSVNDKDILDYYIQRGWVFTVMKIDTSSDRGEEYMYNINPVLFSYSANSLVYPVRLTSINSGDRTDIIVYVLSDSKMTFSGARIDYANRIDDKELESIMEYYPAFGGLIGQQRYLTRIRRTFSIMEMEVDIEIINAPDNEEFRKVIYYGVSPATDFIPLGIVAAFFLIFRALKKRARYSS